MAGSKVGCGGASAQSRVWRMLLWYVVGFALAGPVPAQQGQTVLTTAGAVHSLSQDEARKALPVHFRGVVTFYDPMISSLFVNDKTGGVYVSAPWKPVLPIVEGTLVEVSGVSGPGEFAPVVASASLHILGPSHSPSKPPRLSVLQLATGSYDCRWVEVEGVVHSLSRVGHMISLRVATRYGTIVGLSPANPGLDYAKWLDARVRLRGVAAVDYNKHQQMTGSHLFFQSMDDVQVMSFRRGDPFALPVRPISRLAQFDPHANASDGVHVRGRVVLQWPGRLLCVQDASGGLCVEDTSNVIFAADTLLDVFGYPVFAAETPALMDATVRPSGAVAAKVSVQATTAGNALADERSGELVSVEGRLAGVSADGEFWQLTLLSGDIVYSALLPKPEGGGAVAPWLDGSYVRVTGVCRNEVDARMGRDWTSKQRMASIRILMRAPADIVVLRKPSWWTPAHMVVTLSAGLLAMLASVGWVVLLRRQVEEKTNELRASEGRFRHLAHHDSLTGLPNRAWFHERAEMALALCKRNGQCVGLLLLDLDHFKPVNDTLGHDAGDAMLCALAERVSGAVRQVDTVARLGGDEFAVVLLQVSGGDDAELVARKILAAVCQPLTIKGVRVAMSASIGVAVFPEDGASVTELLRSADLAMYESKKLARGGVRRYQREVSPAEVAAMTDMVRPGQSELTRI